MAAEWEAALVVGALRDDFCAAGGAPLVGSTLVVRTDRDRRAFVRDVPAIMTLLDPTSSGGGQTAFTFEGFYLEAADQKGPFVRIENVHRGETEGAEWSWNRCAYPYPHSEPFGAKPCG
jgi:hypothetical protein